MNIPASSASCIFSAYCDNLFEIVSLLVLIVFLHRLIYIPRDERTHTHTAEKSITTDYKPVYLPFLLYCCRRKKVWLIQEHMHAFTLHKD